MEIFIFYCVKCLEKGLLLLPNNHFKKIIYHFTKKMSAKDTSPQQFFVQNARSKCPFLSPPIQGQVTEPVNLKPDNNNKLACIVPKNSFLDIEGTMKTSIKNSEVS